MHGIMAWETAVVSWMKQDSRKNEYLTDETTKVPCVLRDADQQPKASISSITEGDKYTKKTFALEARLSPGPGRAITSYSFGIDVTTIETRSEQAITTTTTVASSYDPSTLTEGRHTATVSVTDDKGNTASETVQFSYDPGKKKSSSDG